MRPFAKLLRTLVNILSGLLTSRTVDATAQASGLPPNVLKCCACWSDLAICGVVTTAAIGKPLPMLFAIVTAAHSYSVQITT